MPTGYHLELSLDPAFGSTVASVDTTVSPSFSWEGWVPESDLLDCTEYYWRVAARNESSIGPYSNKTFTVQVGTCAALPTIPEVVYIPELDQNCRIGPNPLYQRLAVLNRGQSFPINAQVDTSSGLWFLVRIPPFPGDPTGGERFCFARGDLGEVQGGDPVDLPETSDYPALPQEPGPEDDGGGDENAGICPSGQSWVCNYQRYPPDCYCK